MSLGRGPHDEDSEPSVSVQSNPQSPHVSPVSPPQDPRPTMPPQRQLSRREEAELAIANYLAAIESGKQPMVYVVSTAASSTESHLEDPVTSTPAATNPATASTESRLEDTATFTPAAPNPATPSNEARLEDTATSTSTATNPAASSNESRLEDAATSSNGSRLEEHAAVDELQTLAVEVDALLEKTAVALGESGTVSQPPKKKPKVKAVPGRFKRAAQQWAIDIKATCAANEIVSPEPAPPPAKPTPKDGAIVQPTLTPSQPSIAPTSAVFWRVLHFPRLHHAMPLHKRSGPLVKARPYT